MHAAAETIGRSREALLGLGLLAVMIAAPAWAHDVSQANARYVEGVVGAAPAPFLYLGAKHMVTGLDHVAFLVGVVFFLRSLKDITLYVTLFTLGHSLTLLTGVLAGWSVDARMVDTVIGLSVVYKAFENLGGMDRLGAARPDMRMAVFVFGLVHGLGLATKLQDLAMSNDGLLANLIAFNIGVEVGQVLILVLAVSIINLWRETSGFEGQARLANIALMTVGFVLMGVHAFGALTGRA